MTTVLPNSFFKGPITSCEYLNDENILIGYGPYLTLVDEETFKEHSRHLALQYRVIHKIVKSEHDSNLICVLGQKSFNIVKLDANKQFSDAYGGPIELNDWIFDIHWYQNHDQVYLIIVLAHNQCVLFNLNTKKIEKIVYCEQRCMLYSAKVIDTKIFGQGFLKSVFIASGTIYNQVLLWSPLTGQIHSKLNGHDGVIFNISFQNNLLFSVSDDRSINVWKLDISEESSEVHIASSELFTRFYGHDARVWQCACFVDEITGTQYACSIGEDLNCCLWNLKTKALVYRFKAMRKGSKNIWSLCVNEKKCEVITGWADGGLRKFELKTYMKAKGNESVNLDSSLLDEQVEWSLSEHLEKDYIRDVIILKERIICCTNLGCVYATRTAAGAEGAKEQMLLLKSDTLANYNIMAKVKLDDDSNHWKVAIGTLKGSVYLLDIKIGTVLTKDEIKIEQINTLIIEESQKSPALLGTSCSTKISMVIWHEYKCPKTKTNRYFLIVCFGFMNGLMHLYELTSSGMVIKSRLKLPECKHRWLTSFSILAIEAHDENETIYLAAGDKCGSLSLYSFKSQDELDLNEPIESFKSLVKDKLPVSSIYSKRLSGDGDYLVVCCCKDGLYRIFDFKAAENASTLTLINKYQINSYVDLIESFIFDEDLTLSKEDGSENFDLETSLRLALCFYGDRFMLWNFQLNRALFEFKCGGANRSWDYELFKVPDGYFFRFVYLKDRSLCELSKVLSEYEVKKPFNQAKNHFSQIFHGNTITVCKYLKQMDYVVTGGEDTQLIVSAISEADKNQNKSKLNLFHKFHLQGHDSSVKCITYCELSSEEILLVSAGGMANIKLWKIYLEKSNQKEINKITRLYEFKRLRPRKEPDESKSKVKPWLYVDLEKNPDVRFMDVAVFKNIENDFTLCFACSDGAVRHIEYAGQSFLFGFGTRGRLLLWNLTRLESAGNDETVTPGVIEGLHQSGINAVDMFYELGVSPMVKIATVGDDTRLSIIKIDLTKDFVNEKNLIAYKDRAHASAIVGVKFLNKNTLVTISKDQRLIVWNYDEIIQSVKESLVRFFNVADASSMESVETEPDMFRITIVGVGIEILYLKLN